MAGRLPSILRRRDDAPAAPEQPTTVAPVPTADAAPSAPTTTPAPASAPAAPAAPADGEPTQVLVVPTGPAAPGAEAVAGEAPAAPATPADPEQLPPLSPGFRDRGRLRRRLRYLREVRELGYRDLGGLVFDLHRFGRPGEELVRGKLEALAAIDRELRALARAVDDRQDYVDLREAGVAACPRCAALHGSDANFCPACGLALDGSSVGAAGVATVEGANDRVPPPVQVPLWGTGSPGTPGGATEPAPGERRHASPQPLFGRSPGTDAAPTHDPAATQQHPAPAPGAPGA